MKTESKFKVSGRIEIRDAKTGELLKSAENLDVDSGLNLVAQFLNPSSGVTGLTHCAIGTGTTAPAGGNTQITTEVARLQITSYSVVNNQFTAMTFFPAATCTYHIKEVGTFGNGATGTANSGTMFNHSLIDYDNSSSPKDLVISSIITLLAGESGYGVITNLLTNGSFEVGDPPTGWSTVNATLTRWAPDPKVGSYSCKFVGSFAANQYAYQTLSGLAGKTITFGAWVWASSANKAAIFIIDPSTGRIYYSSLHSGSSSWEWLSATATVVSNTPSACITDVALGDTAYFDGAILITVD